LTSASPSPSSSRPVCRPPLDHSRHFSPRARHARVVQHSSSRPEVRLHRTARSRARLAPRSPPRPRARRCPSVPTRETLPYARQSRRFVARSRGAGTIERRLPRAIGVRRARLSSRITVARLTVRPRPPHRSQTSSCALPVQRPATKAQNRPSWACPREASTRPRCGPPRAAGSRTRSTGRGTRCSGSRSWAWRAPPSSTTAGRWSRGRSRPPAGSPARGGAPTSLREAPRSEEVNARALL